MVLQMFLLFMFMKAIWLPQLCCISWTGEVVWFK